MDHLIPNKHKPLFAYVVVIGGLLLFGKAIFDQRKGVPAQPVPPSGT